MAAAVVTGRGARREECQEVDVSQTRVRPEHLLVSVTRLGVCCRWLVEIRFAC